MADSVGITASSYARGAMHRPMATDESNPYFAFDPTLCIVCSRCVRACDEVQGDRKSTRLNSSHSQISYAVFCLKKKKDNDSLRTECTIKLIERNKVRIQRPQSSHRRK